MAPKTTKPTETETNVVRPNAWGTIPGFNTMFKIVSTLKTAHGCVVELPTPANEEEVTEIDKALAAVYAEREANGKKFDKDKYRGVVGLLKTIEANAEQIETLWENHGTNQKYMNPKHGASMVKALGLTEKVLDWGSLTPPRVVEKAQERKAGGQTAPRTGVAVDLKSLRVELQALGLSKEEIADKLIAVMKG